MVKTIKNKESQEIITAKGSIGDMTKCNMASCMGFLEQENDIT